VKVSILLVKELNAITAGTATKSPNAVSPALPRYRRPQRDTGCLLVFIPWKALMIPMVVPNSPTNGATERWSPDRRGLSSGLRYR